MFTHRSGRVLIVVMCSPIDLEECFIVGYGPPLNVIQIVETFANRVIWRILQIHSKHNSRITKAGKQ